MQAKIHKFHTISGDQRFSLSLLVLVTGLVMTLQNPMAQDSAAQLLSKVQLPNAAQVLAMRPQIPPPGIETDHAVNSDIEEMQTAGSANRENARSGSDRSRSLGR